MAGQSGAVACHIGPFPFPVTNSFLQSSCLSMQCLQSCALSSLLFSLLSLSCAQGPRWAHPVLVLGWEHWLCQWGLLCKLQGECGNRVGKNHCSVQLCISVVRKTDGKVIYYYACDCEPGRAWWWWWGPATPLLQDRLVMCDIEGTVSVPVGSILGRQSLKPFVTSLASSAVPCPGMLQQRMLTK